MDKNIKWIFFDVGSTLVDESAVYESRMRSIAESAGMTYQSVYETAIGFYKQNKKGDIETAKLLNVPLHKWDSAQELLYHDARDVLEKLNHTYKIGVIANQELGTQKRLEDFGILQYISLVIASAEEGVAKPDRKIFEIALERSKCPSVDAVMVGDRIDNDIVPAKEIGMKSIWVKQGFGKYWQITNEMERPDYSIDSLTELLDILL